MNTAIGILEPKGLVGLVEATDALAKAVILSGPSAAASLLRARNATAVVVLADGTVRRLA